MVMPIDKEKLAYAISAIWALICLPISEFIYDEVLDSGFLMRIFALLLVLAPIWIVFGWRWLTSKKPMPAKIWIGISGVFVFFGFAFASDRYLDEITFVPVLCLIAFLLLVWNFERENLLWWKRKSINRILPSSEAFKAGVGALVQLTEELSNEINDELHRLAPDLKIPLPIPLHATDSLLAAYSLIYFNMRELGFKKGSKIVAIFSGYKSLMITNYVSIASPKLPGLGGLTEEEMNKPEFRDPAKKILDSKEEPADTVRDNLARNAANPFYPFYDGLRPYVGGTKATAADLNSAFDSVFSRWNGKAKIGVESLLRQLL